MGDYGYIALFLSLFLGIVGLPINDETLVMLAGFVASRGILKPIPAFLVTYLGVLSGMNIGFVLGRLLGDGVLDRIGRRSVRLRRQVVRAQTWLDRYGAAVILVTYYVPGVRHVVPYLVGVGRMSYQRYALVAFSGGLVWTALFFVAGYLVGEKWQEVAAVLANYGRGAGVILALVTGLVSIGVWFCHRLSPVAGAGTRRGCGPDAANAVGEDIRHDGPHLTAGQPRQDAG